MEKDNALATLGSNLGLATDAKLTPAQLIDLVMEEMVDEVESELKDANEELEKLNNRTFSFDEVKHVVSKGKFRIQVDTYGQRHQHDRHHTVTFGHQDDCDDGREVSERDKVLGDYIRQVLELDARVDELRTQKQNIDGNKRQFRATVMKRILEGTAEGRNILTQIKTLKLTLRAQLSKKRSR